MRLRARPTVVASGGLVVLVVVGIAASLAFRSSAGSQNPKSVSAASSGRQVIADSADDQTNPWSFAEQERPGLAPQIVASLTARLGVDPATIELVGSFSLPGGGTHEVYSAKTSDGGVCLIEERPIGTAPNRKPNGISGGSCSSGPLPPDGLKISVSAAGNVDTSNAPMMAIVGLVGSAVKDVKLKRSDGASFSLGLNGAHGFGYAVPAASGATPVAIEAFDQSGAKIRTERLR
jgi:hypothetical protein